MSGPALLPKDRTSVGQQDLGFAKNNSWPGSGGAEISAAQVRIEDVLGAIGVHELRFRMGWRSIDAQFPARCRAVDARQVEPAPWGESLADNPGRLNAWRRA